MDKSEFVQTLQQLGNRYLSAYAKNVERFAQALSGDAREGCGSLNVEGLPQRYAEFVRNEGAGVVRELAEAGLNYYAAVLNTGVETASRFYEQVLVAAAPAQPPPPAVTRSALLFRAAPGATALNAFLVTNHRHESIDVRFDVSELVSEDGITRVHPEIRFTPAACRLGAGMEQVVQCTMQVPAQLPPGVDYRGRILVAGFPELAMEITLRADQPVASTAAVAAAEPAGRRSRKRNDAQATGTKTARRGRTKRA